MTIAQYIVAWGIVILWATIGILGYLAQKRQTHWIGPCDGCGGSGAGRIWENADGTFDTITCSWCRGCGYKRYAKS